MKSEAPSSSSLAGIVTAEELQDVLTQFRQKTRHSLSPCHRWKVWNLALDLGVSPTGFGLGEQSKYASLKAEAMKDGAIPKFEADQIEIDLDRTGIELKDDMRCCLDRILKTFVFSRSHIRRDTLGKEHAEYVQGMAQVVALLLHVSKCKEEETFNMFVRLMDDYRFCELYDSGFPLALRWQREHSQHIEKHIPELSTKCAEVRLPLDLFTHLYCLKWFMTLFVASLPLPLVIAIVDVAICSLDREPAALRDVSLSLVELMSPALVSPELDAKGLQDAVCHSVDTNRFVETLERRLQHKTPTESWQSWQVLTCGYAGFLAGSAPVDALSNQCDELSVECNALSLQSQWNWKLGLATGAIGTLAIVAIACHAEPTAALALVELLSTQSHVVHEAAVPITLVGLWWLDTVGSRVAEPFIELGQDMFQAMGSFVRLEYLVAKQCS